MSRRKDPGRLRIIEALESRASGYNELWTKTGLRGNLLSKYLKELQKEGRVERDIESRKYRLTQDGQRALRAASSASFLEQHPPAFFELSLGIEGPYLQELGGKMMDIDYSYEASLSCDQPIGHLIELFRKRSNYAPNLFLSQLVELAYEKGLVNKRGIRGLSKREWRLIFKELCPRGHEIIWLERVDLRDLLRVLTHPKGLMATSGITVEPLESAVGDQRPRQEAR